MTAAIPADWPVQPLTLTHPERHGVATCGACGRSWDDTQSTSMTPTPAGRCPFEQFHDDPGTPRPRDGATFEVANADADELALLRSADRTRMRSAVATERLLATLGRSNTLVDIAPTLSCTETEALADWLAAYGHHDQADTLRLYHVQDDDSGDADHTGLDWCATCRDYAGPDARLDRGYQWSSDQPWVHHVNGSVRCPGQGDDDTDDTAVLDIR